MHEEWIIRLSRTAERRPQDDKVNKQRDLVLTGVNNKGRQINGWTLYASEEIQQWRDRNFDRYETIGWGFDYENDKAWFELRLVFDHPEKRAEPAILNGILRNINTKGAQPNVGRWELVTVNGEEYQQSEPGATIIDLEVGYAEVVIPENWRENFKHLYGLDWHAFRVIRAIEAGLMSPEPWIHRLHCVLQGPPGCGKSDLSHTLKTMLGEDAVMEFDATSTTQAGAIKELTERDILPRILIIEEIEKADQNTMRFLLGLMDMRAEIRKTTARATIERDTKLFVIATVNNVELFEKMLEGALASRFSNKIEFARPDRTILQSILEREVTKVNGDFAWIEPTLNYCEAADITDPRQVISICMCGRELLVTGEFQEMLQATAPGHNTVKVDIEWEAS